MSPRPAKRPRVAQNVGTPAQVPTFRNRPRPRTEPFIGFAAPGRRPVRLPVTRRKQGGAFGGTLTYVVEAWTDRKSAP